MRAPFSRTFFELLQEQARENPTRVAVISHGQATTYQQLASRAQQLAGTLRADGLRRGDHVGLLMPNQIEWLEVFFAAAALGATVVPVSTWSTPRELAFLIEDSKMCMLFIRGQFGKRNFAEDLRVLANSGHLSQLRRVVSLSAEGANQNFGQQIALDAYRAGDDSIEDLAPGEGASAADPVVQLYTSGSSAHPKAVPLRHYAAIENGFNIGERQGLVATDQVFVPVPLFWSYGAVNALPATLTHGATLVLQEQFEPTGALDLIERYRCTSIYTLPAITNALLTAPTFDKRRTQSLRTGVTIGAPQDVIRAATELGADEICNIYGSTETYGNCAVTWHYWPLDKRAHCQGNPLPGVEVRTMRAGTDAVCDAGETGELEVRGYLTAGYAGHSSENNKAVFRPDGFFRTGDLAVITETGEVQYAGRSSEMIKRSGINVSPAEIEEVIQSFPGIGMIGVTGAPDDARDERIVAYIVPKPEVQITSAEIISHCQQLLSSYKLPDEIIFCDALPLTPTGKLMRKELKVMAMSARA